MFDYKKLLHKAVSSGKPVSESSPLFVDADVADAVSSMTIDTVAQYAPSSPYKKQQLAPSGDHTPPSCKAHTSAALQRIASTWSYGQKPSMPKGCLKLAGKMTFSPAFQAALGTANVTDIHGLENMLTLEDVFEALLEREASHQFCAGRNSSLQALMGIKDHGLMVSGSVGNDGTLHWHLNHGKTTGSSWTALVGSVLNLSRMDSLATLASILNMNFDNLHQLSSAKHAAELHTGLRPVDEVPALLHLRSLPAGDACAELVEKVYSYGHAGQVIGAILRYRLNGKYFCLPATVGRNVLCVGKFKATAHWLDQHLMDTQPYATLALCQDMRTALAFRHMMLETRGDNPTGIIVTAHLGSDLSILPSNYLHGRHVVFVPAPTKSDLAMVKLYEDMAAQVNALSFKVYKGFLLHSALQCTSPEEVAGISELESQLLDASIVLEDWERPSLLVKYIMERSVPYAEFKAWGQRLGLFKTTEQDSSGTTTSANSLVLFQPQSSSGAQQSAHITDVGTSQIFAPSGIVLLHGLKDAGKSMFCFAAAKALITGEKLFGLFRSDETDKLVYVDSETPQSLLTERLNQFGLAAEVGQRLFLLSKFDHAAPDYAFSLTDHVFRDKLENTLLERGCRYLLLDNLTSLMDEGRVYQSSVVSGFFQWVEKLQQQHGICTILVHHTQDDANAGTGSAKTRGSQEFSIRAHTEVVLIRATEILEKKLGTEAVLQTAERDGLTLGVCFKVCKAACVLQKKTFWLHLPLGASQCRFLGVTGADGHEVACSPAAVKNADLSPDTSAGPDSEEAGLTGLDLSQDEQRVYTYITERKTAQTGAIGTLLQCQETKARSILKRLEAVGLIEAFGKGPTAGYKLSTCYAERTAH